jgi:thiamine biosynthesis lipoprotein
VGEKTLLLCDHGAATSGTRLRRWGPHHHLIDPRTGLPSESDLSEVSVVAASGLEAEVYAKTALLLGSRAAGAFLDRRCAAWAMG